MSDEPNRSPIEIDCGSVHEKLTAGADLCLLDCRELTEYDLVHLPDAKHVPMGEIPARIDEIEPHRQKEIVVYCHAGIRSLDVAMWLRQHGFSNARSMMGGIDRWSLEIDPTLPRY